MGEFVFVQGRPATFLTAGEAGWKDRLRAEAPTGLKAPRLQFQVESWLRGGHRFDLDNLCSVVIDVVASPPIRSVWATVRLGEPHGVWISEAEPPRPTTLDETIHIPDPPTRSQKDRQRLPELARSDPVGEAEPLGLHLAFSDRDARLHDFKFEGPIKPLIDALWPLLGGTVRSPADWRIRDLRITRAGEAGVDVGIWQLDVTTGD